MHTHILFGVDDGAIDLNASLDLIDHGIGECIDTFVLTPHLNYYNHDLNRQIDENFRILTEEVLSRKLGVSLILGGEVHFTYDLFRFSDQRIGLFGLGGKCLLLEFAFDQFPFSAFQVIEKLINDGMTVVIAHPERIYPLAVNVKNLTSLRQLGCLFQITAGSLNGFFGRDVKNATWKLLDLGFVDFVASDVHHPTKRPFGMKNAYDSVAQKYGIEKANDYFYKNQQKYILGVNGV